MNKLNNNIPFFDTVTDNQQYQRWERNNLKARSKSDQYGYKTIFHESLHWIDARTGRYKSGISIHCYANPYITIKPIRFNRTDKHIKNIEVPVFV